MTETKKGCELLGPHYEWDSEGQPLKYDSVSQAVSAHMNPDSTERRGVMEELETTVKNQTQVISLLCELLVNKGVVTEEELKHQVLTDLYAHERSNGEDYPHTEPEPEENPLWTGFDKASEDGDQTVALHATEKGLRHVVVKKDETPTSSPEELVKSPREK